MQRKIFFVVFIIPGFIFGKLAQADSSTKASNLCPIHELNKQAVNFGTYEVKAYVLKRESNYLVVSDENTVPTTDDLTDSELIVFVPNAKEFEVGQHYKFLIQVLDVKSTRQKLNNMKVVYSEKIMDKVDLVLDENK